MGNTRKVPQRGANRQVDLPYANFPRQSAAPATPGASGAHVYTFDSGGLTVLEGRTETGGRFRFLRDQADIGYNNTGSTIAKGRLVRTTGSFTNPSDANDVWPTIALADNSAESTMFAMGMATADIPNNSAGRIYSLGFVSGLDTSGLTAGQTLYLGTNGTFTTTKPTAVGTAVQIVGDVMTVNATTGSVRLALSSSYYVNVAASSGAAFDRNAPVEYDDFSTGSTGSGNVGKLGWALTNGTITYVNPPPAGRVGIARRTSSATANQVNAFYPRLTATAGIFLADALWDVTFIVAFVTPNANLIARIGLADTPDGNPPTNGAYFEKLAADTQWFGVTRAASSQTRTAQMGTVPTTTYQRFRVRRISSTQIGFSIDGGTETVATATLPGAVGSQPFFQITPTTTTAQIADIDWAQFGVTGLNR